MTCFSALHEAVYPNFTENILSNVKPAAKKQAVKFHRGLSYEKSFLIYKNINKRSGLFSLSLTSWGSLVVLYNPGQIIVIYCFQDLKTMSDEDFRAETEAFKACDVTELWPESHVGKLILHFYLRSD